MKIDFVVTWVDGNDPEWRKQKNEYSPKKTEEADACRYRDMDIFNYWFRAVETYAPWVNKVYLVTWGHLPTWLNTNHPKLVVVKHEDYIPEEYRPTFSSRPIELNFHRIQGLSEHFVTFNDDTIINAPITPEFFFKKGLPCDFLNVEGLYVSDPRETYAHSRVNNTWVLNNHFSYIKSFLKNPFKYVNFRYPLKSNIKNILKLENVNTFPGFLEHHMPLPFLKSTFVEGWEQDEELLDYSCRNRFRTAFDLSHLLFRYRQLVQGQFRPVSPKSRGKYFSIGNDNSDLVNEILGKRHKMLCINDSPKDVDFDKVKAEIVSAYERKLPRKSEFEI